MPELGGLGLVARPHRFDCNAPMCQGECVPEVESVSIGSDTMAKIVHDPVNHPHHYTQHPSGVECIQVTEHMNFNLGNAVKYIWRASLKNGVQDLEKAAWYVNREIERLRSNPSEG